MGGVASGSDDALIDLFRVDAIFRSSRTRLVPKDSSDCSYRGPNFRAFLNLHCS